MLHFTNKNFIFGTFPKFLRKTSPVLTKACFSTSYKKSFSSINNNDLNKSINNNDLNNSINNNDLNKSSNNKLDKSIISSSSSSSPSFIIFFKNIYHYIESTFLILVLSVVFLILAITILVLFGLAGILTIILLISYIPMDYISPDSNEIIKSFVVFSYCNLAKGKNHYKSVDEDIKEAMKYTDSSFLSDEEKSIEHFLERDKKYNDDVMDAESLLLDLNKQLKESGLPGRIVRDTPTSVDIPLEKKSLLFDYSPVYIAAEKILKSSKSPFEKQEELENLLNESWYNLYLTNFNSVEHNKDYIKLLSMHINNFSQGLSINLESIKNKEIKHLTPLFNLPVNDISLVVFKILFPILFKGEQIDKTTFVISLGKSIFNRWAKSEYLKTNPSINFLSYKDELNFSEKDFLNIGDLIYGIISNNSPIFNLSIDRSDPENTKLWISPEIKIREMFERKLDLIGFKLPMVCPPVKWSDDTYGGYLSNKSELDPLIKSSKKSNLKTTLTKIKKDVIYNSVNYMSQVPYSINQDILNFILNNYEILGLKSNIHSLTSKYFTSSRKIKLEIESHNSAYYLQKNILGLARLLSNVKDFYFPIEMDWRGRLYSQTNYITFQGNEIAKALIQFNNAKKITDHGLYYFKIYGANVFGVDKESFTNRVKWVNDNHQNIIDMDINFILKASEPFIFIAFCFEYRKYISDPDNFVCRLPIMLDASCNGLQHLSAMVGESSIAKNVNLLESDPNIKPNDFYQFCLDLISSKLNEKSLKNPLYSRIAKIQLSRAIIKRSIMTIPYNVTKYGILLQLEEFFEWVKIDNTNLLKPIWYNNDQTPIYITKKELYLLSEFIHNILFDNHPLLKELVQYLNDITQLLFKLSLPVVWITPSGLIIKQNYTKFKKLRVKPSMNKSTSTYTILVPTDGVDINKQKAAFMPNLVHSMDAANVCLMINYLVKQNSYINLFTVHDCFASTADSIQTINTVVRLGFLRLYGDNNYLNRLHKFYLNYINEQNYIITENNTVISPSGEELIIPTPPKTNDLDLKEILNKAIYFIH